MHEGGVLLEEGRVYSMGVGGSCSRHNPRSVQSHPRRISHSRKETHSSQRRASTIRPELKMPCGAREGAVVPEHRSLRGGACFSSVGPERQDVPKRPWA